MTESSIDSLTLDPLRRMLAPQAARRQGRRRCTPFLCDRVARMDLQHKITEALEEHVAVIHQLAAVSSLILQVAGELVDTLQRQGKVVLCGNGGVPAMPNISPQKCRVSAPILTRLTGCWHSP